MDTGLTGKVVLVTGGSSGIGQSTVELLAAHGAKVAFTGRDSDKGKAVAGQLSDTLFVQADVSIESQVEALFNRIDEQFDDIYCLVNNAGIPSLPSPLEETETSHWNEVIGINLTGAFFCMKHALRRMKQKGKGAIVNVSSIGGVQGFANVGAYIAAKHGMMGMTKSAALENACSGIRINAVLPGYTWTPMVQGALERAGEGVAASLPPMAKSEDVAEAIVWLLSDQASFVSGSSIVVDGGTTSLV